MDEGIKKGLQKQHIVMAYPLIFHLIFKNIGFFFPGGNRFTVFTLYRRTGQQFLQPPELKGFFNFQPKQRRRHRLQHPDIIPVHGQTEQVGKVKAPAETAAFCL